MRKEKGRSYFRSPHEHLVWIVYRENDEIVAVFSNEVMVNAYVTQREEDLRIEYREVEVWLGPCAKCKRTVDGHMFGDACSFFEVSKTLYQKERYRKPRMRPGTTLTALQDLGEAVEECKAAIIRELRLDWLCEKLSCLILAFQKAMRDTIAWHRACKELREMDEASEKAGAKKCEGTFNEYLRARWGDGDNQEKEKQT